MDALGLTGTRFSIESATTDDFQTFVTLGNIVKFQRDKREKKEYSTKGEVPTEVPIENLVIDKSAVNTKVQESETSYQAFGIVADDTTNFSAYEKIYGQTDPGTTTLINFSSEVYLWDESQKCFS